MAFLTNDGPWITSTITASSSSAITGNTLIYVNAENDTVTVKPQKQKRDDVFDWLRGRVNEVSWK